MILLYPTALLPCYDITLPTFSLTTLLSYFCQPITPDYPLPRYLATGLSSIGGLTSTPLITLLTKLVDRQEMGAVLAMASGN